MARNKEQTIELLKKIAAITVDIQAQFDEIEPEFDPNNDLQFIHNLLDLVRQEGPVYNRICMEVAESFGLDVDHLDKVLSATQSVKLEAEASKTAHEM